MSLIILNVDEVRRTLSVSDTSAFVVNDKNVDVVRFALNTGFTDVVLDEYSALRVMYQRPGETQVRAKTLTYYDTDGLRNYYDWQLLSADLAEKGTLNCALCILRADMEVEEWHTTPYQIRVLGSIHTDDSDEADETITPTVAQRVAVLETMIQRIASGAPIVVASASAMTDTEQIYVLSTDGNWYYHNGSAWVAGGEYGAVATDTTLTQSGMPADAKAVGDKIAELKEDLSDNQGVIIPSAELKASLDNISDKTGLQREISLSTTAGSAHSSDNDKINFSAKAGEELTLSAITEDSSVFSITVYFFPGNNIYRAISTNGATNKYTLPNDIETIGVYVAAQSTDKRITVSVSKNGTINEIEQKSEENAKKIENIETVVVNESTLYVKGNLRVGSLQPNGVVDNSTYCYTQKSKIPVTPGEKILIVPNRPSGMLSAKLRLVTYQTESLVGETGTIKVSNVIIPVDGYEYTIPDGCTYILYCVYCHTDASGSIYYNNIFSVFSDTDTVCRFEYLDRKKELALADDLAELDAKTAEKADKSIADALSVEKTESGNGTLIFSPMPNTKIAATQSGTFTGRNLKNIYSAFGVSFPTIDNAIASRHFWGSGLSSVNALLNQLPVGMYTLSVGFLLEQQSSEYDGSTVQKAYLYVTFDGGSSVRGVELDITNKNTGDIVLASVSFEITQQTTGKITHAYMYCPNTGSATTTKWKTRIAYAQIESGDLSEQHPYIEKSGSEIEAYDSKMSFSASGDYTLTYRKISVETQDDEEELPAYFQTEVDDCVSKLENYCTDKSLVYMIVTDTHVHNDTSGKTTKSRWKDTIKNMKAVHKGYQVDSVIHLGDMVNGSLPREQTKSIIRMIRDDLRSIVEPNFILVGNHDTNTFYGSAMDEPITEAAMYGLWERYNEKDITSRPSHLPYWYKDYDPFGIRVIYLSASMGDGTHGGRGANWGYPEAELTWLSEVALDTDYQVLFFSHMPFTPGFISDASTLPQNGDRVIEIVTEFQTNGGVVIGLVNGHTHFDYSFGNGHFREVSLGAESNTGNTANKQGSAIAAYVPASAIMYGRIDDTLTQDLWSILVVKPDVRQCRIIRFGAGDDFTWSY